MSGFRRARGSLVGLATTTALLVAGCAKDAPQDSLKPQGPAARSIDNLMTPVFGAAAVVFVLVLAACVIVPLKFRARDGEGEDDKEFPEQVHGNFKLEIGWTILPAVILAVVAFGTVAVLFSLAKEPKDPVRVEVVGQQWWWEYRYDVDNDGKFGEEGEVITANDLVIPAGRPVALSITARDVIHSFWVPALNGKRDAVPGRTHPLTIEADKPGEYIGQCTEYCGLSHANMHIKAIAVEPAEYEEWLERNAEEAPTFEESDDSIEAQGYRQFNQLLCSSCHLIDGVNNEKVEGETGIQQDRTLQVSGNAPNLTHLFGRTTFAGGLFHLRKDTDECKALGVNWAQEEEGLEKCFDDAAMEAWLRNPPEVKPMAPEEVPGRTGIRGMPNLNLTEEQIDQLVAYLKTLK
jgi:cytochrome c oxidase subunit 2